MDILNIYSISGLFYELYDPSPEQYSTQKINSSEIDPLRRTNALFWAKLFEKQSLEKLITRMREADIPLKSEIENAVLSNPALFINLVHDAPKKICNYMNSPQEMFSYLEQLEIACKLFSKFLFHPFTLSIQDGFQVESPSASQLLEGLFDKTKNPYLVFLEENIFNVVDSLSPKLIWVNGPPRKSSLTIAAYLKKKVPGIRIALRNHSSEYYSMNKIDAFLRQNHALFSVIDCIVLDDNKETYDKIERALLRQGDTLTSLCNIIWIDRESGEIHENSAEKVYYSVRETVHSRRDNIIRNRSYLSPACLINLKLNPNTACYWNKCTFCGINKKYKYITNFEVENLAQKCDLLEGYIANGVRFVWFEDEAILPQQFDQFSDEIIRRGLRFQWQARSRIDLNFTEALFQKLYRAGLREIRFGLESASPRIWSLMNKFPPEITLKYVEDLVRWCTRSGIHVHFPMIVGFPTETIEERITTYRFLLMLRDKYKNVSYNINVLMLDISSELYKHQEEYGIQETCFPCPCDDYLNNTVDFRPKMEEESRASIDLKRDDFMQMTLYPWMPKTALIRPHIFYRLSETIRNTLIWSCKSISPQESHAPITYVKNPRISSWPYDGGVRIYNWDNHRIFQFSEENYFRFMGIDHINESELKEDDSRRALIESGLFLAERG